jgi:DNA-directed RNA polymerase specialized sigma24 family protein
VRKAVLNALRDEVDRLKTEKHGGGRLISFQEFLDSESGEDPEDPTQRRTILRPDETKLGTRILPDEAAHRLLLAAYLDELLAQIPPQQANVLRDDFLADLNHNAIAKKRGIKLGSVGVLRQRGLNALLLRTASRDKVLWDTKAPARPKPRKRHEPKEAN